MGGETTEEQAATTRVAGEVRLMTEEPVSWPSPSEDGDSISLQLTRILSRRPWLAPASILGFVVVVLLLRRHSRD